MTLVQLAILTIMEDYVYVTSSYIKDELKKEGITLGGPVFYTVLHRMEKLRLIGKRNGNFFIEKAGKKLLFDVRQTVN